MGSLEIICSPVVLKEKGRRPWVRTHGLGLRPSCECGWQQGVFMPTGRPGQGCPLCCLKQWSASWPLCLRHPASLKDRTHSLPPAFLSDPWVFRTPRIPSLGRCFLPALLSPGHKITWLSCFSYPLDRDSARLV